MQGEPGLRGRPAELAAVSVCGTVAVAALLGRVYDPGVTSVLGVLLALLLGWSTLFRTQRLALEEKLVLVLVVLAAVVAGARWTGLFEAKEVLASWLIAILVWMCCRHVGARAALGGLVLLGAAALFVSLDVIFESVGMASPRAGGFFANPNISAALLVPMAAAGWTLCRRGDRASVVLVSTLTVIFAGGALLTGSRAAALALVVAVTVGLPRGRLRLLSIGAAVAVGLAFISWRFSVQPDSLAWHRFAIWRALAQLVAEHPLTGVGPGAFADLSGAVRISEEGGVARHFHRIGAAESTPLGLLVRTGFLGTVLAAAGLWSWVVAVRKSRFFEHGARRALFASIVVFCLVHDELDITIVLWWWAALLGCLESQARGESLCAGSSPRGVVRWVAALMVCGLVLWGMVQPAYARHLWRSSTSTHDLAERAWRAERWYVEPLRWRTFEVLGRSQWSWEDAAEAMHWSRRAVEVDSGKACLWSDFAKVHSRVVNELGRWPDAVERVREGYRRATALEPHLPWDWLGWAQFERSLGEEDGAVRLARRAVIEEPNFVRAWLFLARIEIDRGRAQEARAAFTEARRAWSLRRAGALTKYESDLLEAPGWQFEDVERNLN